MPDIKGVLQDEIKRLAKREIKAATAPMLKSIMELKRKVVQLERALAAKEKEVSFVKSAAENSADIPAQTVQIPAKKARKVQFNGKKIIRLRKRLHLSQAELAALVGVNMFSVSHWELGKNIPRQTQTDKLEEIRLMPRKLLRDKLIPIREEIKAKKIASGKKDN